MADTTAPTVPAGVTASAQSSTAILVGWSASTDSGAGLAGYRVFRGSTQVGTTAAGVTSFADIGLAEYGSYSYTVQAYDLAPAANVSAASTAVTTRTLDVTAPSNPGGLTATATGSGAVQLSWTASTDAGSGVGGYRVFRGATQVGTTNATT